MGGAHCLICYSRIPNSNTFNSLKNPQTIYVSLCKLLQLPVETFRDILSGSPTCPECAKGLQEGAQVIRRFEVLRREINQLRTAFENKLVKAHKLSIDLNDLEDGYKERSSIIKELNLDVNSFENDPIDIPATQFNNEEDPGSVIDYQYEITQEFQVEEDPMDIGAHEEEIEMDKKEIFSLPQPNLIQLQAKDLKLPPRVAQIDHEKPSTSTSKVKRKRRRLSPASRAEMLFNRSNRITLKVPLLQLDRLPDLPRGQITFNLDDLLSLGINPLQNTRRPPTNPPESNFKLKFVCRLCSRFLSSQSTLFLHYKYFDHSSSVYRCCGEELSTISSIKRHRVQFHRKGIPPPKPSVKKSRKKRVKCDKCDKYLYDRCSLRSHINSVHLNLSIKPFACTWPGCGKTYVKKKTLEDHMKGIHEKIRPLLCEHCPKAFASLEKLTNHRRTVHELEKIKGVFKCDKCPSTFPYERALQGHIKRVHNHDHILCTICGFELKQKDYYKDHMEMHRLKGDKFRPRNRSCWKRNQEEIGTSQVNDP